MSKNITNSISPLIDAIKGWSDEGPTINCKLKPSKGTVTWDTEGTEGGRFHSRKLHVPTSSSGLTIGRGYDMKQKNSGKIVNDLTNAGVDIQNATTISMAAGKYGHDAKNFISENDLNDFEVSQCVQKRLFDISYLEEEQEVKRISEKPSVVSAYGKVDWKFLDLAIKEILIDLKFRGDYTGHSREKIQKYVVNNDLPGFAKEITTRRNWPNVPNDRFMRRKHFIIKAVEKTNLHSTDKRHEHLT